jgi:hypothetical protein
MLRILAALFFTFAALCTWVVTGLSLAMLGSPDVLASPLLAVGEFAMATLMTFAAVACWRRNAASPRILRWVGIGVGPAIAIAIYSLRPEEIVLAAVSLLIGWGLLAGLLVLLAKQLETASDRAPAAA